MQHQVTDGVIHAKYTTAAQRRATVDQNGGPWGFHLSNHGHIPYHLPHTHSRQLHAQQIHHWVLEDIAVQEKTQQMEGCVKIAFSGITIRKVQVT